MTAAGCKLEMFEEYCQLKCLSCHSKVQPKKKIIRCQFCDSRTPLALKGELNIEHKVGSNNEKLWFVIMQSPCCQSAPLHQKSFYCSPECYFHGNTNNKLEGDKNLKVLLQWYSEDFCKKFPNIAKGLVTFRRFLQDKSIID